MRRNKRLNKYLEFMQKNYAWIIAIITGLGIITSNILKFFEYIIASMYFSYYEIDINLYQYSDRGFIYSLCLSILFLLAAISLLYCIYQITINIKNKKIFNKVNSINTFIILISNLIIIRILGGKINISSMLCLIIIEVIFTIITFKELNKPHKDKESLKGFFLNYIKMLPFVLIIVIICLGVITIYTLKNDKKDYRIINENKVIVYSNNNYYITLDCSINNNSIVIYKGTQEKINNTNVYNMYRIFDKVDIK